MRLRNEKKEFNRNYISVIISSFVLLLLIAGLVFFIIYNPISNEEENINPYVPNFDAEISIDGDDTVVDVGSTKCSKDNQKNILNDAKQVGVKLKTTEYIDHNDQIIESDEDDPDAPEASYFTYDAFEISITNITKNLSVVVTDNCSSVSSNCKDGSWTFNGNDVENNTGSFITIYVAKSLRYTVSIYSNIDECENELYRQFIVTTPTYNIYANSGSCMNSESDKCDLLTYDDVTPQDIVDDENDSSSDTSSNSKNSSSSSNDDSTTSEEESNDSTVSIAVVSVALILIACASFIIYKNRGKK